MRQFFLFVLPALLFSSLATAQQLTIRDFVLFGKMAVRLSTSTQMTGGSTGSDTLVQTTGNTIITGNIHSGGRVELSNSNTINGNITAANKALVSGNIFQTGSNAAINGNAAVKGNVFIGGGFISGTVTLSGLYSGPDIGSRLVSDSNPPLPLLPFLPQPAAFDGGTGTITNSRIISPESHNGNLALAGNKTLTFSGAGKYYFNSIKNSGNFNNFVFDFAGNPTGVIRIYVKEDVDLYKLSISFPHGGDASRVYMEVQGNGSTAADGTTAWTISNGASGNSRSTWQGTVYAPNGNIIIGKGSSEAKVTGALWSGKQVAVESGVSVTYMPLVNDDVIVPFNPSPFGGKVYTPIGAELTSLLEGTITKEAKKVLVIRDGYVLIEVIALEGKRSQVVSYVLSQGMKDTLSNGANSLIVTGYYPIAKLDSLNHQTSIINFVRPVFAPFSNSGLIQDAGDIAVEANLVRGGYNLQGDSAKVGVISDSYNTQRTASNNPANNDTATRDLPGLYNPVNSDSVKVLLDYPFGARSDEGRAMLQIVHDIAPKSKLVFRTGFISPGDFAIGIRQLQEEGCNVIVDDITYITEPFLRDGTVAKMVDSVKKLGVSYFSSAGNFSNKSHEQLFNPRPAPAGFPDSVTAHSFNGTGDIYQQLRLLPGSYTIVLQWDDDIYSIGQTATGTLTDLDIYLLDLSGNLICGYNRVSTFGDPVEILAFTVNNSVAFADANLLITKANGGPIPLFKYIIFRGSPVSIEYQTGATTIVGQANAKGAIAVGAVNYFNTPAFGGALAIAPYSSVGGTSVRAGSFELRNKPDIAAPDGVNTSVNMGADIAADSDPFSNFFGTSAAAPHAAAVAALMINGKKRYANETLIPDSVKAILQRTALHFGTPNTAGAGLIQASVALQEIAMPTPALISLQYPAEITPANLPTENFTLTLHGSYLTTTSQVIFRDSTLETTFVNDSELVAILPPFTGNPPIKVYTPPIANGDGGYSNTIYFFSVPKLTVTIKADDKTKKYGEQLPAFTSTITVYNPQTGLAVPLNESGLTLQDVGLQTISYETNADSLSNVGSQYFIKPIRTFDSASAGDISLLERFDYITTPGILTITKLPVKVIPNDQTITYGQDIQPITFRYEIDPAIATTNPQVVNIIRLSHEEFLATDAIGLVNRLPVAISNGALPVAISNGFPIAISNGLPVAISNGEEIPLYNAQSVSGFDVGVATITPYTFTPADLANLSFYASEKSLASTRQLTAATNVIDITQQSILDYNDDPSLTYMVNTVEPVKAKGILGAEPLSNGSLPVAISNAALPVAISNAFPIAISNGALPIAISNSLPIAISNGALPIAISNSFTEQAHRIAVVIDQNDVDDQTGIVIRALNVVTGITAGQQSIIPGSVLNDNYEITYGLGKLTINPAVVTIKAVDTSRLYGEPNPVFRASYSGLQFGETLETSDIKGSPVLTTNATETSAVGTYDINIDISNVSSANYTLTGLKGTLTVLTNPCFITHSPFASFNSTPKPNTATSLWLNIETKVSGQLTAKGDYLLFTGGTVTLNNITSNPAVVDLAIPRGIIMADNVPAPVTSFDLNTKTWTTRVPVGFSSTSDIFISGAIIQSSSGFVKKNGASSVVKGIFYSSKPFSDQWSYAMATYRPQFNYADVDQAGEITSVNGNYRAGTPTTQIRNLVSGGTSGGGNNYTGSNSSYENFTACLVGNAVTVVARSASGESQAQESRNTDEKLKVIPNPASGNATIQFMPSVSGQSRIAIFTSSGTLVSVAYSGLTEQGKMYHKRIDVSKWASGLYIIQFKNGDTLEFRKLIIAR
jgi:hypothetical protein